MIRPRSGVPFGGPARSVAAGLVLLGASACASSAAPSNTPASTAQEASPTIAERAQQAALQISETAVDAYRAVSAGDDDADVEPADQALAAAGVSTVPVPIAGSDLVRGRSTVTVKAPIERVRDAVLGFSKYPEFMPHYSSCKLLGRTPAGARDVYMEISALHGALRMWARVEVPKPVVTDGVETYETKFVDGNVRDFKAIWRLKKIDETSTELSLEVFLHPKIPMPTKLINDENVSGSAKGVAAMRARAESAGR